ncbi:right-handed parallel beta-helix repeat-containing protein [Neobacillus drentensis]|uniref:right-handed parallel beta-helix repeat-containing protein n=1 Tax=Neobacillus drentensis TaxID=220684 RepID=UPI003000B475
MRRQLLNIKKGPFLFVILFLLTASVWLIVSIADQPDSKENSNKSKAPSQTQIKPKSVRLRTPEDFGANGFDKKIDTKALQAAIENSDTLTLKNGATYIIDKPLVSEHSIKIESDKNGKKKPVILQISKKSAFILNNTPTTSTVVSKRISINNPYVTLQTTRGMKAGDLLHLTSNKLWYWDNRGYLKKGELHKITKIEGNKVYLDRATSEDYMVGAGEIVTATVYPNISIKLSNISFTHPKAYKTAMLKVNYTSNTDIENVSVSNSKHIGIFLNCTYQTQVRNSYINLGTTKDINTGYGIQDYGGSGTIVTSSTFKHVRRGVDFSGKTPSRYGKVSNSKAYGYKQGTLASGNSGFGTHSTAENITFENNYVENFNYGFLTRGNNIIVKGNTLEGYSKNFIAISYGGSVNVMNNTYKSKNGSKLENFLFVLSTYNGSISATGNRVVGQKGQFINGEISQLKQLFVKGNSVIQP